MYLVVALLFLTSLYPLARAWRCLRHTSLAHALVWASVAWAAWGALLAAPDDSPSTMAAGRYVCLCLTGCAGVAVLGARRPGVGAWNFVVLGLLAVFLLSWAEGVLTGHEVQLGGIRIVFLSATLGVGLLNYLPTRLAPAVLLVAVGCGLVLLTLLQPTLDARWPCPGATLAGLLLGLAPWTAWLSLRTQRRPASDVDRLWLAFRDGYGLFWGQRLREQFNRAAANAGWPMELRWHGLETTGEVACDPALAQAAAETLRALFKRFGLGPSAGGA